MIAKSSNAHKSMTRNNKYETHGCDLVRSDKSSNVCLRKIHNVIAVIIPKGDLKRSLCLVSFDYIFTHMSILLK